MNVFQFAQQMEQDGEAYYRDLAEKTEDKGLKTIFLGMADDEVKHFKLFKELEKKVNPKYASTQILSNAKNVFAEMKEQGDRASLSTDHVEAYRVAMETEQKSETFYKEKANEVEEPYAKDLFLKIADEEKKHAHLLENIINFVNQQDQWLENAEFNHLEEY